MYISDVLRRKGTDVTTTGPAATVRALLAGLAERNIGAVVVLDGETPVGVVSERDIVRQLHGHGERILDWPVAELMATPIVHCAPNDTVDSVMVTMTERRIRHLPVVERGKLAGVVSIGDVVKHRVETLEEHREQLESYIVKG